MVKQIVQAKLRDTRCKLKRKHFNNSTEEERKNCPIPCMTQEDWDELNKTNRQKICSTHTLGTKSLARHYADEDAVANAFLVANKVSSQDPKDLGPILDEVYNGHHGGYERGLGEGWTRAKNTTAVTSSQKASQLQEANDKIDGLTEMVRVLHEQVRELQEQGNGSSKSGEPSSSDHDNASGCGPSS
ncbi:hypothetical protein H6P81_006220 [Aristolochia fimbriata]|uniref:Transposase, Ptta/En/Spm, plant n=1 Tax=Aristolochia fimbriata TaxID=158543 RepID=A0AAV7F0F2_ARIFI|nr:hypothetical protein H6P81_006220 [Aristolochia fimbriata]